MSRSTGAGSNLILKTRTRDVGGLLITLKDKWTSLNAGAPFAYSFLDDRFNNTYNSEQNIGRILCLFAGLTIFVACIGLFGLATFTAERRTKEIGIRKVLGATNSTIVACCQKIFSGWWGWRS